MSDLQNKGAIGNTHIYSRVKSNKSNIKQHPRALGPYKRFQDWRDEFGNESISEIGSAGLVFV